LQRKRGDCGTGSPVIAALCGQNANRQSEQEHGGDNDYVFGHHESPLGFWLHLACMAVYSTAVCDGRHKFREYEEFPLPVPSPGIASKKARHAWGFFYSAESSTPAASS
jgi:hypothetical protein